MTAVEEAAGAAEAVEAVFKPEGNEIVSKDNVLWLNVDGKSGAEAKSRNRRWV